MSTERKPEKYFAIRGGDLLDLAQDYADKYYAAEEAQLELVQETGAAGFVNHMGYRCFIFFNKDTPEGMIPVDGTESLYIPNMKTEAGLRWMRKMYDPDHVRPCTSHLARAMGLEPYAVEGTKRVKIRIEEYMGEFVVAIPHAIWNRNGKVFQPGTGVEPISEEAYLQMRQAAQPVLASVAKPENSAASRIAAGARI